MGKLESISREFCGEGQIRGFPSLEKLKLEDMTSLKEWHDIEDGDCPLLRELCDLVLDECNEKILGSVQFLSSLSSLKELRIQHFYRLEALKKEVGLQDLVSLQHFEILCCPKLVSFPEGGFPSALQHLSLGVCNSLQSLPKGLENLPSLEELIISKCPKLVTFPE